MDGGGFAAGIDDEGAVCVVALGQVAIEEIDPVLFGGTAAGGGCSKTELAARLASIWSWTRRKSWRSSMWPLSFDLGMEPPDIEVRLWELGVTRR